MIMIYGTGKLKNYVRALNREKLSCLISQSREDAAACRGLLLPGGGDIPNALDRRERELIKFFLDAGHPVLGICRGMQALNVYFGGTLYAQIAGHQQAAGDLYHPTRAVEPLSQWIGPCPTVNSNHHQAVQQVGEGLRICQWTQDGIVEALVHERLPVLGVQWHPERMGCAGRCVFQWLKEASKGERRP